MYTVYTYINIDIKYIHIWETCVSASAFLKFILIVCFDQVQAAQKDIESSDSGNTFGFV